MRQRLPPSWILQLRQIGWWLSLLTVFLFGVKIFLERYLVVQEIICTINDTLPCTQSLLVDSQKLYHRPLLFYNFQQSLQALASPALPFQSLTYHKIIPHTLQINFYFLSPIYQLLTPEKALYSFDVWGHYTVLPMSEEGLVIELAHTDLKQMIVDYKLDAVLHQKLLQLHDFSTEHRQNWQQIKLYNLNQLEIKTDKALYIVDLFNLDENLQKLFFLEDNWQNETDDWRVDLRFRLPVLQKEP